MSLRASFDADVIVAGGGLSGLVAAHRLQQHGLRVQVIEAADQPGGVIRSPMHALPAADSRREHALRYEAGPNTAMDGRPEVGALIQALGLGSRRVDVSALAARRYLLWRGRVQPVPGGPLGFIATPLLSARAKLRLLAEPWVAAPATPTDESIAAFVRRRLGDEVLEAAVEPLVGGIFAGDVEQLSMAATFPALAALEARHGSLLRGAVAQALAARAQARRDGATRPRARSFSFDGGMQVLTDTLAGRIAAADPAALTLDARVIGVQPADGGFAVEVHAAGRRQSRRARALLLALPASASARLISALGPAGSSAAKALDAIVYPPMATVSVAYRRRDVAHRLDGFGFLVPRREDAPMLGTLFPTSMFPGRAPADLVLLTSFVGGCRRADIGDVPDTHLAAEVVTANARFLGAEPPLFSAVHRYPQALPQTTLGHAARLARVATLEAQLPGLTVTGNWRDGVSIADCIAGASARADQVAQVLPQAAVAPATSDRSPAFALA